MRTMQAWDFSIWLRKAKSGSECIYAANVVGFAFLDAVDDTDEARVRDVAALAAARGEVFLWQRKRGYAGFRPVYDYIAQRSSLKAQIFADKVARNAEPVLAGRDFGDE